MDKIWECPSCKKQFETKDFKYCPYCSNRLSKIVEEFVPLDPADIPNEDKIKAFDNLFIMAKNFYLDVKTYYNKNGYAYVNDDDEYYFFKAVMNFLGVGIENGVTKMWESYNKFLGR